MKSTLCSLLFLTQQSLSGLDYHAEWELDAWDEINSMCAGDDESPIDVSSTNAIYDTNECLPGFKWNLDLTEQTFKVTNNGHSVALTPSKVINEETYDSLTGSRTFTTSDNTTYEKLSFSDNTIATFPNYFQPIGSEHNKFCLDGLHFHWGQTDGTGSEHLIDGKQYPLELHFVHYSCEHEDVGTTVGQFPTSQSVADAKKVAFNDVYQLGVIGILFEISEEDNPAFDALFTKEAFGEIANFTLDIAENTVITDFSIADLIPLDEVESAGYYAYKGSLTTPPCTNIVRWHLMNAKGSISSKQMEKFRALNWRANTSVDYHSLSPNYRLPQNNVNPVYACMEPVDDSLSSAEKLERGIVWTVAVISLLTIPFMAIICLYRNKRERVKVRSAGKGKGKNEHLNKPTSGGKKHEGH